MFDFLSPIQSAGKALGSVSSAGGAFKGLGGLAGSLPTAALSGISQIPFLGDAVGGVLDIPRTLQPGQPDPFGKFNSMMSGVNPWAVQPGYTGVETGYGDTQIPPGGIGTQGQLGFGTGGAQPGPASIPPEGWGQDWQSLLGGLNQQRVSRAPTPPMAAQSSVAQPDMRRQFVPVTLDQLMQATLQGRGRI